MGKVNPIFLHSYPRKSLYPAPDLEAEAGSEAYLNWYAEPKSYQAAEHVR